MAVRVVTDQTPLATPVVVGRQGAARALARALVRNRKALAGLSVFGFFVLVAIFAPLIAPYDPSALAFNQMLQPSRAHLLGTTGIGQDIFSQLVFGTRESLLIALAAGLAATAVSVIVGVSAAYLGGLWDHALNLFTDVFLVLPTLPLMIIVGTYLNNRGLLVLVAVIVITGWSYGARQLRSQALSLRNREFLEAARARGERSLYIIVSEVLPTAARSAPWIACRSRSTRGSSSASSGSRAAASRRFCSPSQGCSARPRRSARARSGSPVTTWCRWTKTSCAICAGGITPS